jgi:hypothetical protein
MAIRVGGFKLVRYDRNADTLAGGRSAGVTAPKLYNLAKDIGEANDLATSMPDKVTHLQARWDAWNATLVKPLWGGRGEAGTADATKRKANRKNSDPR